MTELSTLGVHDLLEGYRRRSFTPEDVLEACFQVIETVDADLGAVLALREGPARQEAQLASERWRERRARPLEGIPVGLKDVIDMNGMATTAGSPALADNFPSENAAIVHRISDAGAIVVGKLATSPFAFADPFGAGAAPTPNPWDPSRFTGGTSTGPAAALAARLLPLAIATDSAGSVRVPAAHTGVCGLKPSAGSMPHTGVVPSSWSLDCAGIMARSAEDIALALPVLRGDYYTDVGGRAEIASLYGKSIGVLRGDYVRHCTEAGLTSYQAALDILAAAGAQLVPVDLPESQLAQDLAWPIFASELASSHEGLSGLDAGYGPVLKQLLGYGRAVPAVDYLRCQRMRVSFLEEMRAALAKVSAVVCPTVQAVAPTRDGLRTVTRAGETSWFDVAVDNTLPFSVAGFPALSIPIGLADDDLPFGLQIAAIDGGESAILEIATAFQTITQFHEVAPGEVYARPRPSGDTL